MLDVLIVSGGGDWGAFGAGFLKGWHKVPAQHPLAKPEFDVVTGVSTGTLIAPFAFLGDEPAIDQIVNLYRNPGADWVKQRGMLYFLPDNISFSEVPGLEREMRRHITMDMVRRIAKAGADGRMLVVNTTNLDDAGPRVFDLVEEAQRAVDSGELERIHEIMLASAGIPGAFPFRIIDQELYVDGGVTGNILYGGRAEEEDALPALWQRTYPDVPIPKIRFWIIFNNQFRPVPHVTAPRWIGGRSTKPGDGNARCHGHRGEASRRTGGDRPAQTQRRRGSSPRVDPRRLVSAGTRGVHQGDHEQSGRSGRAHGRGPGKLE